MLTRRELARKILQAGDGSTIVRLEDLEVIGISVMPLQALDWEAFCAFLYKHLTGHDHSGLTLKTRASRSRQYAKDVAQVLMLQDDH